MAAPPFSVSIASDELTPWLNKAQRRLADMTPLMREILGVLDDSVQQAFEAEADPVTGNPWQALSADYVARRGDAHPILQRGGDLASPQPEAGADYAQLGFPEVYAALHQFGGTADMPPGPAAVPARPFAGVSPSAERDILRILAKALEA